MEGGYLWMRRMKQMSSREQGMSDYSEDSVTLLLHLHLVGLQL